MSHSPVATKCYFCEINFNKIFCLAHSEVSVASWGDPD